MKILLPIDGSDYSNATLKWAAKILDKQNTELYLLSVIETVPLAAALPPVGVSYENEKRATVNILKAGRTLLEDCGFCVKEAYDVLSDDSAFSICEYADKKEVDQIIIGSQGKTGLDSIWMGNVSQKVFRDANQPVLLINNIQHPDMTTFKLSHVDKKTLQTRAGHIQKILIPIDESESTKLTLQWAIEFLNPAFSLIYLVHVIDFMPESLATNGLALTPVVDHLSESLAANDWIEEKSIEILEAVRIYFESQGFSVADAQYLDGKPAEAICKYASQNQMDQIVIGSHGRKGLASLLTGSVAQEVFKNAKQAVIVLNNTKKPSIEMSHLTQVSVLEHG